jgi:hypothetical protein
MQRFAAIAVDHLYPRSIAWFGEPGIQLRFGFLPRQ